MYKYEDLRSSERHLFRLLTKQNFTWCCNGHRAAAALESRGLIEKTGISDANGCRYRLSAAGKQAWDDRVKKIVGRKIALDSTTTPE